jgi:hypothetical protein
VGAAYSHELWPFALATGLIVAVGITEALALLVGASTSQWIDGMLGGHAETNVETEGPVNAALGWLHIGKVPILAILVIFLTTFAAIGFASQFMMRAATGWMMPQGLAVAIAAAAGVLAVRFLGRGLARVIPRDETSAITDASLIGRVGTVVIGTARAGRPAEARLRDEFGTTHYVMVEPEDPAQEFAAGASVLLVRHLGGRRFHAILNPKPELL